MLSLMLLGKPVVRLGDHEISGFRTTKSLALLCYLAVQPETHSRQSLTGLLWSDDSEEKAQNSLRVTLSNLNKLLPDVLEANRLTVALRTDRAWQVDALDFETLTRSLDHEVVDDAALAQAVALYRGDFLADLSVAGAPLFEEWLVTQRSYYRERLLTTLERVAEAQLAAQNYPAAVQTLERLLVQEPWHEAAYRQLMTVYSRMGDFTRALTYYERCRAMLAAELDVTPMPETEALHERIQAARRAVQYELPVEISPFVGREAEMAQLRQLLADPDCRLITICGLGGMGKSRLALALARQAQRGQAQNFLNGVVWVSLAGLDAPESMPLAVASALRLPLSGQTAATRQLLDFLRNKEILLVLDNFEFLSEGQGNVLGQILATCPDVKVLVTSWEPLNLAAEWRFDLGGLSYPRPAHNDPNDHDRDGDNLEQYDAVQLFVQTARQARSHFVLGPENAAHVRALCQLVGGMPLAIKLAAAWLRMMQVQEVVAEVERGLDLLATQMRDVPPRQRSMRAVFEQTWALLTEPEQRAMAALSSFRGGFRREAAEQVAGATLPMLMGLMDRALLQVDRAGRYFVHELLRQFAAEKLAQDAVAWTQTQDRHAHFYTDLLDQLAKPILGYGQRQALATVAAEIDNIRVAWQRVVAQTDVAAIAKSVYVLISYHDMQGWYRAGVNFLEDAVAHLQRQPATLAIQGVLATLYVHLGWGYIRLGQYEKATEMMVRSQATYQETTLTPPPGLGTEPLIGLGVLANIRGDYAEAFRLGDEARRLSELRGDGDNLQNAYAVLTSTAVTLGQYAQAMQYARQAHHYATVADNQWFLAYIYDDLGMIEYGQGNFDEAMHYYTRSYDLRQEFDDPGGIAITLMHMAEIAMRQQNWAEAIARYERSLKSYYEIYDRGGLAMAQQGLGRIAVAQGNLAEAQRHFHSALQTASQIGYMTALLAILEGVGEFLLQTNRAALALTVFKLLQQHPASNAKTREHIAKLLATHAEGAAVGESWVEGDGKQENADRAMEQAMDEVVTRLLVELAIQPR